MRAPTPPRNSRISAPPPPVEAKKNALLWLDGVKTGLTRAAPRIAVGLVVLLILWAGRLYFVSSPLFDLRHLKISGLQKLSRQDVLLQAGIQPGQNIFSVSATTVRKNLESSPWVASARVQRRFPDTLTIQVTEHQPIAVVALNGLYLVSQSGNIFKAVESTDPPDLPFINGFDTARFMHSKAYRTHLLAQALRFIELYRKEGYAAQVPFRELRLLNENEFAIFLRESETYVRLGTPPFENKLQHLMRVLARLRRQHQVPEYIYFAEHERVQRVTVKVRDSEQIPALPTQTPR